MRVFYQPVYCDLDEDASTQENFIYNENPARFIWDNYRDAELFILKQNYKKEPVLLNNGDIYYQYWPNTLSEDETISFYKTLKNFREARPGEPYPPNLIEGKHPIDYVHYYYIRELELVEDDNVLQGE